MADRTPQQQVCKPPRRTEERRIERVMLDRDVPGKTGGLISIRVSVPRVTMHVLAMAETTRP